jgi:acetyl/propionyl-CoA carboxylase alpha subunit
MVEESPSPLLDTRLREEMGNAAVAAARACGYVNAGTIEFLVGKDRRFFFLEMNTRIQVEHPVTEMVTGTDLVRAQIRIASGEPLPLRQEDLSQHGHALECRVNAEDPGHGFAPSAGKILLASFPSGAGVRVDAGVATGDTVSPHYDSLLAKVIVHASDRATALERMREALGRTAILGVETNISFLRAIIGHPVFRKGESTTSFIERELADWRPPMTGPTDDALIVAAVADTAILELEQTAPPAGAVDEERDLHSPWGRRDSFRLGAG